MDYKEGTFETRKFASRKEPYYKGLSEILSLGYETEDLIHHFPSFVGHMTLARFLVLYEAYKMTLGCGGSHCRGGSVQGRRDTLFRQTRTNLRTGVFDSGPWF